MKNLSNLKGAKALNLRELKEVNGGRLTLQPTCQGGGDPECCGTGPGQCGVGHCSGGMLLSNGTCACF
ncbi:MAG: hypothetical protein AB8G15_11275 [Saprospiraceae bacterium]